MEKFNPTLLRNLYIPPKSSHKGQNGRLLIIGGSHLFHSASLWALKVASRIVDLVHYSSVQENNDIVQKLKEEFRDGIVVHRKDLENYIKEDDCILIGPGMLRTEFRIQNSEFRIKNMDDIEKIKDEGKQTYYITKYLLQKYPKKKWVIDAGALQMMEPEWIPANAILTPHHGEFNVLYIKYQISNIKNTNKKLNIEEQVKEFASNYNCVVLHKGEVDIISDGKKTIEVSGGNQGMTKGGTGDVLAGLVAAFYTKNDALLAATSASYINKKAGDELSKIMGLWFNASDLSDQIPKTMKEIILDK